jgi:hypothetical protein
VSRCEVGRKDQNAICSHERVSGNNFCFAIRLVRKF